MATMTTVAPSVLGLSEANGINDDGAVVGQYDSATPYLWLPQSPNAPTGAATQLPTLFGLGVGSATAMAVNNSGAVVGFSDFVDPNGNPVTRAVIWNGGNVFPIPTLIPDPANPGLFFGNSRAVDINDNGDIVGRSDSPAGGEVGFLFESSTGQIRNLFSLVPTSSPVPDRSRGTSINNNGDMVGVSDALDANGNVVERAFLLPAGASFMIDLGTLVPDPNNPGQFLENSAAYGINDAGRIIGSSDDGSGTRAATDYFNGFAPSVLLSDESEGFDVGPTSEVVGSFGSPSAGFVLNGGVVDLNTLVATGGTIDFASSINAAGQIVASANFGVGSLGILITP